MKRTDLERVERELKRREKRDKIADRRSASADPRSVKVFTDTLFGLFRYDDQQIYNAEDDEEILELLLCMKEELLEKQWDPVLRKAVRMTEVADQDAAVEALRELMAD
jgi:hypothetical protein